MSADRIILSQSVRDLDESPAYEQITGVKIITGQDSNGNAVFYAAGNDRGRVLEIDNPWGTERMAQNILQSVGGYAYKPYKATDAIIDPASEIGDAVSVGGIYSVIADVETTFSPLMSATISAPDGSDIDHEFPYESAEKRSIAKLSNSLNTLETSFIVTNGEISGRIRSVERTLNGDEDTGVVGLVTKVSEITNTVDGLTILTSKDVVDIVTTDPDGRIGKGIDSKFAQYLGTDDDGNIYTLSSWSSVNITTDKISTLVSEKFDKKGAASDAYKQAKKYVDGDYKTDLTNVITASYESAIEQQSDQIKSTVASAVSKYDTSTEAIASVTGDPNAKLSLYGYGKPVNKRPKNPSSTQTYLPASEHSGEYYLSQGSGYVYYSNGSEWIQSNKKLPTLTTTLRSEIKQTVDSIRLSVSSDEEGSTFTLTAGGATLDTGTFDLHVKAVNIDGTLTADQIKASDLRVDAAQITGKLDADQIKTETLTVNAANITGTLSADQIDASSIQATSLAAGSTIVSPVIMGGEIRGASFSDSGIGGYPAARIGLSSRQSGNSILANMWYGPYGIDQYASYAYFLISAIGSGQLPYTTMTVGGVDVMTVNNGYIYPNGTINCSSVVSIVIPSSVQGTLDLSGFSYVKMPDGTVFAPE